MEIFEIMKTAFVLWSGGLDSTALIYYYLKKGYKVDAGYVKLNNNENKTKQELDAIKSILTDLSPYNFHYKGIILESTIYGSAILPQFPIWMTALVYITEMYDEISLGYVMNDDAISFLEEIKQVWKSYEIFKYNKSELVFPLSKMNKEHIKSLLSENIFNKTVSCEMPIFDKKNKKYIPCNNCGACKRRNSYLIEENIKYPKLKLKRKK